MMENAKSLLLLLSFVFCGKLTFFPLYLHLGPDCFVHLCTWKQLGATSASPQLWSNCRWLVPQESWHWQVSRQYTWAQLICDGHTCHQHSCLEAICCLLESSCWWINTQDVAISHCKMMIFCSHFGFIEWTDLRWFFPTWSKVTLNPACQAAACRIVAPRPGPCDMIPIPKSQWLKPTSAFQGTFTCLFKDVDVESPRNMVFHRFSIHTHMVSPKLESFWSTTRFDWWPTAQEFRC